MRIRQPCDVALDQDLGLTIRRHRVKRSGLVRIASPAAP